MTMQYEKRFVAAQVEDPKLNVMLEDIELEFRRIAKVINSDIGPHNHDDRYYTETELDAGQLDNRYYTEAEIDAFFEGEAAGKKQVDWARILNHSHASEHQSGGGDTINHDSLVGFVSDEHIDWKDTNQNLKTTGSVEADIFKSSGGQFDITVSGKQIRFLGSAGGAGEGVLYKDTVGVARYGLIFPGSNIVALANRAANGVVQLRANTSTAGAGGEVTVATFEDNKVIFNIMTSAGFLKNTAAGVLSGGNSIEVSDLPAHASEHESGGGDTINHDSLLGFLANEHRAWEESIAQNVHVDNIPTDIPATRIGDGSVENAEFQYLNGVTSAIQAQLDGKAALSHSHVRSNITDFWGTPFWSSIPDKPSTYPPSSHEHDDRYYTEDEINENAFELDADGDYQPVVGHFVDPFYDEDGDGDLMPEDEVFQLDTDGDLMPT